MVDLFRKYRSILFIFIVLSVFFSTIFAIRAPYMVLNLAEYNRYNDTNITDIAYGYDKEDNDCYLNLNSVGFLCNKDDININSDLFMQLDDVKYENNLFYFNNNKLAKGECVVSSNLLKAKNLKIGDYLHVKEYDPFKIIGELKPQQGFDEKAYHEGVTIVGYDKKIADDSEKPYYLTFFVHTDAIMNTDRVLSVYRQKMKLVDDVKLDFTLICLICLLAPILFEFLFQFNRANYYRYYLSIGVKKYKIFFMCLFECIYKYLIPILIACIAPTIILAYCGMDYYLIPIIAIANVAISMCVITLFNLWRANGWKIKL